MIRSCAGFEALEEQENTDLERSLPQATAGNIHDPANRPRRIYGFFGLFTSTKTSSPSIVTSKVSWQMAGVRQ